MKKILFIVGSLRKESFNRKLASMAEKMIAGRAEVEYLDYSDVPMMNQDFEFPVPAAVASLRNQVAEADGVWIFSPEYNYSYPGHIKNLIDWLSRPVVADDHKTPLVIARKKVALSGAGGGYSQLSCETDGTVDIAVYQCRCHGGTADRHKVRSRRMDGGKDDIDPRTGRGVGKAGRCIP